MAKPRTPPSARTPRKITPSSLRNIALFYLQRYASSRDNLKRVLMRRVRRAALFHDFDQDEAAAWVEQLVGQLAEAGLVDDRSYAEGRMRALFRRGLSPDAIARRLLQKGIDRDLVDETIAKLYEETADPKLAAAVKFAKRRRLGPYRRAGDRQARDDKDMAALARAGFDYQTARQVIEAETEEDLLLLLDTDRQRA